jgi:hypothetical protein
MHKEGKEEDTASFRTQDISTQIDTSQFDTKRGGDFSHRHSRHAYFKALQEGYSLNEQQIGGDELEMYYSE